MTPQKSQPCGCAERRQPSWVAHRGRVFNARDGGDGALDAVDEELPRLARRRDIHLARAPRHASDRRAVPTEHERLAALLQVEDPHHGVVAGSGDGPGFGRSQ